MVGYNTIRTLTSFVRKIINIIQSSIWPEYSIAYGKMILIECVIYIERLSP